MYRALIFQLLFASVFAVAGLHAQISTPQASPAAKVEQTVGMTKVTVAYSRPAMRGRKIFAENGLVPFGKVWRTGANANTIITFDKAVSVGGQELPAGEYALFTRPGESEWEVYFYTDTDNWGTPREWDDSKVAAKTKVKSMRSSEAMENFTILFDELTNNGGTLYMGWENTLVAVPIEVGTDKEAVASIERVLAGPTANDYYSAATYYHESGKDLKQAYEWIQKANEMREGAYWMLRRQSLIEADLDMKEAALATAKKSLDSAQTAGNEDYVRLNKESIKEWSM